MKYRKNSDNERRVLLREIEKLAGKVGRLEDAASIIGERLASELLKSFEQSRLEKSGLDYLLDDDMIIKARMRTKQDQVAAALAELVRLIRTDPVAVETWLANRAALGNRGTNPLQPTMQELREAQGRLVNSYLPSGPRERAAMLMRR